MTRRGSLLRATALWGTAAVALSATVATGSLHAVSTRAAAGVTQTVQQPTFLGTGSLSGQGSGAFVDSIHDATAGGADSATKPAKAGTGGTTPSPTGQPVSSTGSFGGFNGLDHFDQRTAGTGAYTNTQFSLEPPDQGLCVGNGKVLESVNTAFQVFDASGAALTKPEAFNQFFGVTPEINRKTGVRGDFLSDPKCNFDVPTQRWFMTILQVDAPGVLPPCAPADCSRSHTFVAVSQSADPLGSWNLFSVDATDDGLNGTPNHTNSQIACPCFGDQPLLGMNADALFISTNEYGTPTADNANPNNPEFGAQIYAISKAGIESASSGNLPPVVHLFAGALPMPADDCCTPWDSIQPATSPTAASQSRGFEYFLSSFTNSTTSNHQINTWVLTGTGSLKTANPELALQRVQIDSETYTDVLPVASPGLGGIAVDQKSGPHPLGESLGEPLGQINANDVRMNQVVYANGKLWSGVNTALQSEPGGPARSGIAYFVVQPKLDGGTLSARMQHQGYVSVTGNSTLFPSVGVNQDGNGAIAFSVVGPDYYPSAAYVRIDAGGSLHGGIVIAGAGTAPDDGFTQYPAETGGAPVGRWGDYSAAVATPDGSIWMSAEYIPPVTAEHPRTVLANWGTFVTHVSIS